MKQFKFYYKDKVRYAREINLAAALLSIAKCYTEFKPLTPKQLINKISIIQL